MEKNNLDVSSLAFSRPDGVVPLWQYTAGRQLNSGFLIIGDDRFFRVATLVEFRTASKTGGRTCCANVLQNDFVAGERFASPVGSYQAEHSMLNQIPLRSARRKMPNGNRQSEFGGKL